MICPKCGDEYEDEFAFLSCGLLPSIVDERSFPKAVKMMKDLYCEE